MGLFDRLRRRAAPEPSARSVERGRAEAPVAEETLRAREIVAFPLGDGQVVHVRGQERHEQLPDALVEALRRCSTFETLEGHAELVATDLGFDGPARDALLEELADLDRRGLFFRRSELVAGLRAASSCAAKKSPASIERVALFTANRPALLRRSAAHVVDLLERFGRSADLTVFDDTRDAAVERDNRSVVAALAKAHGRRLGYVGRADRKVYAERLTRALGQDFQSVVDFALFADGSTQRTTGSSYNTALLTRRTLALHLDDDVVPHLARAPELGAGAALSSRYDPTEIWPFRSRDEAIAACRFAEDVDPLAVHEGVLGKSAAAVLSGLDGELDLDEAEPRLLRRIERGTGRVATTMTGVAGDSAMGSTGYYLTRTGRARERLMADWPGLRASRNIQRAAPKVTLSDGAFFMSYFAGLDGSGFLPPFLPLLRNVDGFFALVLRQADPHALIGHLPWMVEHQPEPRSLEMATVVESLVATRAEDVLFDLVRHAPLGAFDDGPAARLELLGRHLTRLAALPEADFADLVRQERRHRLAEQLAVEHEVLLRYREAPADWAEDVRRAIAAGERAMAAEHLHPFDLGAPSASEALRGLARLVGRVGELCVAWPAILGAATRITEPDPAA